MAAHINSIPGSVIINHTFLLRRYGEGVVGRRPRPVLVLSSHSEGVSSPRVETRYHSVSIVRSGIRLIDWYDLSYLIGIPHTVADYLVRVGNARG